MKYEDIGIDLGSKLIKMALMKPAKDSISIKATNYFIVEEDLNMKQYISYVKECLTMFLKTNGVKLATLSFTVPVNRHNSGLAFLEMPVLKKRVIAKTINYEIDDNPDLGDSNSIYSKWAVVDTNKETNLNKVLILTIQRELIAELSKIGGIKFKIQNIELQPLSFGRNLSEDSMIIDFGHEESRVYIYKNKSLFMSTKLEFNGKELDSMIREEFDRKINTEEVDEIKYLTYVGSNPYEEETIGTTVGSVSRRLNTKLISITDEITRTIRALEVQHDIFINEIHTTGGLANIIGFNTLIMNETNLEVKPLDSIRFSKDTNLSDDELNLFYLAISASAAKEIPYYKELNFGKLANAQIDYLSFMLLILCASIIIHGAMYSINKKYDDRISELSSKASSQTPVISELNNQISRFDSEIANGQAFVNKIESLGDLKKWLSDVLYVLSKETPIETAIVHLELDRDKLIIDGYSEHYSAIGFIAIALEKHGKVSIDIIENELTDEIYVVKPVKMSKAFKITLALNGRVSNDADINDIKNSIIKTNTDNDTLIENLQNNVELLEMYNDDNVEESDKVEILDKIDKIEKPVKIDKEQKDGK